MGSRCWPVSVVVLIWALALVPATASAQSLDAQLASAQNQATLAEQQISEATASANAAQRKLAKVSPKTEQVATEATNALNRVQTLQTDLAAQRTRALEQVRHSGENYDQEKQDQDNTVSASLGFAIGALILAALVLFWKWFRQLTLVQRLGERGWLRAVGIVGGGGLILLIAAAAMLEGAFVLGVTGGFLLTLAFGLPVLLLLARHSLRVERKEEASLLSRAQFPRWVTVVIAAVLLLFAIAGLGGALSSDEPTKPTITAETRALAAAASGDPLDPPTPELLAARQAAKPLVARSGQLQGKQQEAQAALVQARQGLGSARRRLRRAQFTATNVSRRIAREAARQAAAAAPPPSVSSGGGSGSSSPSYSSCATAPPNIPVPPGSPLDGDGDGIGCES
jgi:hypothetical protein